MTKKPRGIFSLLSSIVPAPAVAPPASSILTETYKDFEWTDLESPEEQDILAVAKKYNLNDMQVRQAQTKGQISQMVVEDDYILLILYFPHLIADKNRIASSQVTIFIGKQSLVTIHDQKIPTIRHCFSDHKDTHSEGLSPGKVVFHLIEHLLKDVDVLLSGISADLDAIEESVFNDTKSDAYEIGLLRQKIMRLRRTLATQKGVLEDLDKSIDAFTGQHLSRYYRTNTNATRKLWEMVEEARESIEIYKDADFTTSTEQTNKTLEALTLLFTLTIPATTIGCLYGMNVLIPGGIETGSWTFLGQYTTFELIVGISVIGALAMFLYFRFKK